MNEYAFLSSNLSELRDRIAAAARRSGRDPDRVVLMAVSKFNPLPAIEAAWELGLRHFGESRIQEAGEKFPAFLAAHPAARLEMIGHLQSNKARKAVELCSRVQSVDSVLLLRELDKRARDAGRRIEILLELHTGEASKSGFRDDDELFRACDAILGTTMPASALELRGLMTMAPFCPDPGPIRSSFRSLRSTFDTIAKRFDFPAFDVLSMGMSNDFEIAIEEGSTMVRIGTALFGRRSV